MTHGKLPLGAAVKMTDARKYFHVQTSVAPNDASKRRMKSEKRSPLFFSPDGEWSTSWSSCEPHSRLLSFMGSAIRYLSSEPRVLISQFFLDNGHFLRWRDELRGAGVTVPIEAGILPALSAAQIAQFSAMCGVSVPATLLSDLERCGDDKNAAAACGLDFALRQVEGLLAEAVEHEERLPAGDGLTRQKIVPEDIECTPLIRSFNVREQ